MIQLNYTPMRGGQLAYIDPTQEHVIRREMGHAQDYVYRNKGTFVDKDENAVVLADRNNLILVG